LLKDRVKGGVKLSVVKERELLFGWFKLSKSMIWQS